MFRVYARETGAPPSLGRWWAQLVACRPKLSEVRLRASESEGLGALRVHPHKH
jgi:hypothetical protein